MTITVTPPRRIREGPTVADSGRTVFGGGEMTGWSDPTAYFDGQTYAYADGSFTLTANTIAPMGNIVGTFAADPVQDWATWDATGKKFSITETGMYLIVVQGLFSGAGKFYERAAHVKIGAQRCATTMAKPNGFLDFNTVQPVDATSGPVLIAPEFWSAVAEDLVYAEIGIYQLASAA